MGFSRRIDPVALAIDTREAWLTQVASNTLAGRQRRADLHQVIADAARSEHDSSRVAWHEGRARAELERLERVQACGTGVTSMGCRSCGTLTGETRQTRCGAWRYCLTCRGERCSDYRARLQASIESARRVWSREMSRRTGLRWGERFLTLTVPHSGSAARDFRTLHRAWRVFRRSLGRWLRKHRGLTKQQSRRWPYARVLEITGSDAGHSHAHVWMLTPYLPQPVLAVLWARALHSDYVPVRPLTEVIAEMEVLSDIRFQRDLVDLETVSRWRRKPLRYLPWAVVDVRKASGDIGCELVKYLTKDIGPSGELTDPFVYAQLIEATEGVRMVCAAIEFWLPSDCQCCEGCGRTLELVTLTPADRSYRSRAPPPELTRGRLFWAFA